jgi:hypothetical protein
MPAVKIIRKDNSPGMKSSPRRCRLQERNPFDSRKRGERFTVEVEIDWMGQNEKWSAGKGKEGRDGAMVVERFDEIKCKGSLMNVDGC